MFAKALGSLLEISVLHITAASRPASAAALVRLRQQNAIAQKKKARPKPRLSL
ncbi:MAG: hypothetical protein KDF61_18450 [Rhodocyclaceae bacterium]|nr:hypothetical protein [Rhodocyclaceae bacterium]